MIPAVLLRILCLDLCITISGYINTDGWFIPISFNISINDFLNKTFLEPCVGIGSFVFAYLTYLEKKHIKDMLIIKK